MKKKEEKILKLWRILCSPILVQLLQEAEKDSLSTNLILKFLIEMLCF